MKTKIALLTLGLATASFALDEYLPIEKAKTEVDLGVNPNFYSNTTVTGVPVVQVKYGIMTGLDVELAATYDVGDVSGLAQPDVAVKYALPANTVDGLGVFLDVGLPFATGDNDVTAANPLFFSPGVVYDKNYGKIEAVAKASYQINMKKDSFTAGNVLDIYLKPGYMVNDKLAGYVGLDYKLTGDSDPKGAATGTTFSILPGVTYTQTKSIAYEVNVPIVVSNDLAVGTYWGIWGSVYLTLPM